MPVQYHQPVAPIVPEQRMIAPELIAQAGNAGLNGFIQMNANRQRALLEEKALQQRAVLAEQEFGLKREGMALDFQLKSRDLTRQEIESTAHAKYYDAMADYTTNGRVSGNSQKIDRMRTVQDFNAQATKYGLLDPNPKNPVDYYASYRRLEDEFKFSNVPEIKNALRQIKLQTEQQTIPLKFGGTIDPKTGLVKGGELKQIPAGQIVENLSDPGKAAATRELLHRSGLIKSSTNTPNFIKRWINGEEAMTTETTDAAVQRYIDMGRKTDWSRSKPRVAPAGVAGSAGAEGPNNEVDLPAAEGSVAEENLFEPTHEDKMLEYARRAITAGRDRGAVISMLQEQGIDPSKL